MTTYATWDPDNKHADLTLSDGNQTLSGTGVSVWKNAKGTIGKTSGKFYFEVLLSVLNSTLGICDADYTHGNHIGAVADGFGLYVGTTGVASVYNEGSGISNYLGGLPTSDCVIGVAVDLDNHKIFYRGAAGYGNPGGGVGDPVTGDNPAGTLDSGYAFFPAAGSRAAAYSVTINSGQSAFAYAVPTGFSAGWYIGETVAIEDVRLGLAAFNQVRADLATLLEAAYRLGLADVSLDLQVWGAGLTDMAVHAQAAVLSRGDLPLELATVASLRRDLALLLAAVSPEVVRHLALSLAATDGTARRDLALVLSAARKAPVGSSALAQRVRAVMREVA